ncbi:MAG TPA: hypothetical protein VHW00_06020 [Thermoanaerobaculia bacterium]|nr:hypothetical protein [Thermoanaerobaculia bacterium]
MPRKTLPSQWVLLFDDRKAAFTVRGPLQDDTEITFRVVEMQKRGRAIRCQTVPLSEYPTREAMIDGVARELERQFRLDDAAFADV